MGKLAGCQKLMLLNAPRGEVSYKMKELAKFAAGVTAWETIVHSSFALSGSLPITIFGITITETINTIQIIVPAIFTFGLIYYGWKK